MASGPLELVRLAAGYLEEKGIANARLDAEVLLAHALGVSRLQLYLHHDKPLEAREVDVYREAIRRRGRREPTAYITGVREFWSLSLHVDPRVLIPRPETELLVEAVLQREARPQGGERALRVLDLGSGSGAIVLALLRDRPGWTATAVDVSAEALRVAAENARSLGLEDRIEFRRGDLFAAAAGERYDVIVSNPPYIPTEVIGTLEPEVAEHEPRLALDGGADGLDVIRAIAARAPAHLAERGLLALEFGETQERAVWEILEEAGLVDVATLKDYSGHPRVALARLAPHASHPTGI